MSYITYHTISKIILSLILLTVTTISPKNSIAQLLDRVVAIVNDDVVTLSELEGSKYSLN